MTTHPLSPQQRAYLKYVRQEWTRRLDEGETVLYHLTGEETGECIWYHDVVNTLDNDAYDDNLILGLNLLKHYFNKK